MSLAPIFTGRAKNGKVEFAEKQKMIEYLRGLDGQNIEIVIRRRQFKRSVDQNSFYWAVVIEILSEEIGEEKLTMHKRLKRMFINGRSTTTLSTGEFGRYLEDCQRYGAERNIIIPDPNEVEW